MIQADKDSAIAFSWVSKKYHKFYFFHSDLYHTPLLMSTQQHKIGVIAAFAFMVLSNFLSTATKVMNNTDNAQISRENPT